MIGYFGDAIFAVSDARVYTFRDLSRNVAPRLGSHDLLNRKPATEFIGQGLETISFSIFLRQSMGVSVRAEIDRWTAMVDGGAAHYLVLGGSPVGKNRFVISGLSQAYGIITALGGIVSATLDVSLQEYA